MTGFTCKSCAAPIVWARTAAGRLMPLDAEPHEHGNVVFTGETTSGVPLAPSVPVVKVLGSNNLPGPGAMLPGLEETRYRSHFVSCPEADQWRRKR